MPKIVGPEPPEETLRRVVDEILGHGGEWILITPAIAIELPEQRRTFDVHIYTSRGLTSEDLRFIAKKLMERADFMDKLPIPDDENG